MQILPIMKKLLFIALLNLLFFSTGLAQWEQANGPYTGYVRAIAVDPTTGYVYAGTSGSGLFRSIDNGSTWTAINNGLASTGVYSIAFSGSHIFAGTSGDGIFLSTDNGDNWTAINNGLTGYEIGVKAILVNGSNIYAGAGSGIFLSTDNGSSWTDIAQISGYSYYINSFALSGTDIFAGTTNGGVLLSVDGGSNWDEMNNGITNKQVNAIAVSGSHIFAGTEQDGVYLSVDNALSWTTINNGLPSLKVTTLAIDGANIYAGTERDGIFQSTDNGTTWYPVNNGLTNGLITSLEISGSQVFAGTYGGVYVSANNGGNWVSINNGLLNTIARTFAINGNDVFAGVFGAGIFSSNDNGVHWDLSNDETGTDVWSLAVNGSNIFAGTWDGVYLSTNNGTNWSLINDYLKEYTRRVLSIAFKGTDIFAGTFNGGVYRSSDNGSNWVEVNNGLSGTSAFVHALAVSDNNIFAGTWDGVYASIDNGENWASVNNGLTNFYVQAIAISGSNIYVGTRGGVFLSVDNGSNWLAVNNGLSGGSLDVKSIAINGRQIFAGTADGVFLSVNEGSNWTEVNTGLLNRDVQAVSLNGTYLFAGTNYEGVWKRLLDDFKDLSLSTDSITIEAQASSANTFDIASNTDWTISSDQTWLTADNMSDSGDATITLTAEANTTSSSRTATITISGTDVPSQAIAVLQEGLPNCGMVTDADGNVYNTVTIGAQCWIQENLKATHYNDGSSIPLVTDDLSWSNLTTPGYCWYNNDETTYKNTNGAIYNWYVADASSNGNKNVCPSGWHVPTDNEWSVLVAFLGGEIIAGGKLKEAGTIHWDAPNTGATNETGFTALPFGIRQSGGAFSSSGPSSVWGSSSEYNSLSGWARSMYYAYETVTRFGGDKTNGFYIRCIQGEVPGPEIATLTGSGDACFGSTSTIKSVITGGAPPYTIHITGYSGSPITNYASDTDIDLGILPAGVHSYTITSVADALGNTLPVGGLPSPYTIDIQPTINLNVNTDTLCSSGSTNILVESPTTTTYGIRYTWTVVDNPNVQGESNSTGEGQLEGTAIIQTLVNTSPETQHLQYTITPWSIDIDGNNLCSGIPAIVDVWVEPELLIYDTWSNSSICSGEAINIFVESYITTSNGLIYTWTVADNPKVIGESSSDAEGQSAGTPIVQFLNNWSPDTAHLIYHITPWALDSHEEKYCSGTPIIVDVIVEPEYIELDAFSPNHMICSGEDAEFIVSSPYYDPSRVLFTWTVEDNPEIIGASNGPDPMGGMPVGLMIAQNLINTSNSPQVIKYTFEGFIINEDGMHCPAMSIMIEVEITVNPSGQVEPVSDQIVSNGSLCSPDPFNTINTGGTTSYSWANDDPSIGLPASGNDNIVPFTATNSGSSPVSATITVTPDFQNGNTCSGPEMTFTITVNSQILFDPGSIGSDQTICAGSSPASFTSIAPSGDGIFTYQWYSSTDETNFTPIPGANSETYSPSVLFYDTWYKREVTSTFGGDTAVKETNTLSVICDTSTMELALTTYDVSCNGNCNGVATISASGGQAPYTYNWSNGATGPFQLNLCKGDYMITVNDAQGCTTDSVFSINEPDVMEISHTSQDVVCAGRSDGTVTTTIFGGTAPYSYLWDNGTTTQNLSGVASGIYTLTATDANGCTAFDIADVQEPDSILISSVVSGPSCAGMNDATIEISVSGGVLPYTYLWNNVIPTEDLSGLPPGTYNLTVTDATGCEESASFEISDPEYLMLNVNPVYPACNGEANGSVEVEVSGGTSPYTYTWSNGANTPIIDNLLAGNYALTVRDFNECEIATTAELLNPEQMELNLIATNPACEGVCNGAIAAEVIGGTAPYSYAWSNGAAEGSLVDLCAGNYELTVTDANGCVISASQELSWASVLTGAMSVSDITCAGMCNGYAIVMGAGGDGSFTYDWSDGQTGSFRSNLCEDLYDVTIKDGQGCEFELSDSIRAPKPILIQGDVSDATCKGEANGSISIIVSGGTPEYSYLWNSGQTSQNITDVSAGNFNVNVRDAYGCFASANFMLSEPVDEVSAIATVTDVNCYGEATGAISLTVSGGMEPYQFVWSNGIDTRDLADLLAGSYQVNITDATGCSFVAEYIVSEPGAALEVSGAVTEVSCYGEASGAVALSVSGGTAPYQFAWSNGASTQDLSYLLAGMYQVSITDANGCSITNEYTVTEPAAVW